MAEINFLETLHSGTSRNYLERVCEHDKAACAVVAKKWGEAYWDGDRRYGYGGYHYDGRWRSMAEAMAEHYQLKAGDRVLDVGCGKAFLLYELTQVVPGLEVMGVDISDYALANAKHEMRPFLKKADAVALPFTDNSFDLIYSLTTLHNLYNFQLHQALSEIERVSRRNSYVCIESYRNEREKANLLYWQLTCEAFFTPKEWEWFFGISGYNGDWGYIFFE
ncbi:MAG: class I SAM-dependent methyltransferase [Candidatus Sedimenticola sp. (ex Thyasira tokunagai)]